MAFEIEQTIQSQYAASPHITGLAVGFYNLINPYPDIELFYDKVFNLTTAEGWGLDVWGRIVGISRKVTGVPGENDYLGFENEYNERAQPFNQAPFYSENWGGTTYRLEDTAYRLLIWTKAMANVGTGSLADLNRQLYYLLNINPDNPRSAGVINIGTMKIRIYVIGSLEEYEKVLLRRGDLPPIPAGVGFEFQFLDINTFGFEGSGLQGFDNGVFAQDGGLVYAY